MIKSLGNVIKVLKPEVYNTIVANNGEMVLQTDSPYYTLTANYVFEEEGIFTDTSSIVKIDLTK